MQPARATSISRQLKALADVNRIRILETLVKGECCVSSLVDSLAIDQPKVSHHLAILRNAGVIRRRREGRRINYSVKPTVHRRTQRGNDVVDEFDLGDVAVCFRFTRASESERASQAAPRRRTQGSGASTEEGRSAAAAGF